MTLVSQPSRSTAAVRNAGLIESCDQPPNRYRPVTVLDACLNRFFIQPIQDTGISRRHHPDTSPKQDRISRNSVHNRHRVAAHSYHRRRLRSGRGDGIHRPGVGDGLGERSPPHAREARRHESRDARCVERQLLPGLALKKSRAR
jgi:hypothetical protein